MEVVALPLDGLLLVKPKVFRDERGFFVETFRASALPGAPAFVQDNHSRSTRGTLRGLHFQTAPGQAKLVRCARGRIFDVAVDIRKGSPTFGQWHAEYLDDETHHQLYVPVGFAHGFCVVSDVADVAYKCSNYYDGATESGFAWNSVGVAWPVMDYVLSARDQQARPFAEVCR